MNIKCGGIAAESISFVFFCDHKDSATIQSLIPWC